MSTEHDRRLGGQGDTVWGHLLRESTHTRSHTSPELVFETRTQAGDGWGAHPTHGVGEGGEVSATERPLQKYDGEPTST